MRSRGGAALVGRKDLLARLSDARDRAADGLPSVVVIVGETGVGKTRLVTEFLSRYDGPRLAGACVPVAGEPLPYAALTQALRRASGDGVVQQEVARSAELARLLPRASSPLAESETLPSPAPPAESSRLRLFHAVLGLLDRMGTRSPAVLVVEDVHWADRSTLDLVSFLATNLVDERVLILLTCREESLAASTELAEWLGELSRLGADRVELPRLSPEDAALLVAELADRPVTPEQLEATLSRSAGNPLFVEHLVLAEGEQPGPLPATLRDLLAARVDRLPAPTRRVLRSMSVVGGRGAQVPVLAAMVSQPEVVVEEHLRVAIDAHVAQLRGGRGITFQHPAFREVIYADLLPSERVRLHRAAAQALETTLRIDAMPSLDEPGPPELGPASAETEAIGEIARHWHRAGDLDHALRAAVAAGAAYERVYAFADAEASFVRALGLVDRVPPDVAAPTDRVDLAVRGSEAASLVGDTSTAVRLLEGALPHATDDEVRAGLLERLGAVHFIAGDAPAAERSLRAALALLDPSAVTPLAARVHARFGFLAAAWSWLDEAEAACTRALEISRAIGERREEGVALNALGVVAAGRGALDAGVANLRSALAIAREVESPRDVAFAYVNLSHVLGVAGRLEEGLALCREGLAELTRLGLDRQVGSLLLGNACDALIKAGRLAEAEELVEAGLARHPRGIMAAPVLLFGARTAVAQGRLDIAWERCEQARLVIESEGAPLGWSREVTETAVEVELWAGRPGAAYDLALDGLAAVRDTDEAPFGTMLVALGLRALADDADARRDHRSRVRRRAQRDELLGVQAAIDSAPGHAGLPDTEPLRLVCAAEQARLAGEPAAEPWTAVVETWSRLGRPLPAAYGRWRLAESLLDAGGGAPAVAALRAAHDVAGTLGMTRLQGEVESLARWYRIDLVAPVEHPPSGAEAEDPLAAYALTAREHEVLAAVADGMTNQEIADRLYISVKTASVHVSNILRKLDVSGRQEAARVAHRAGMGGRQG